jgi:predicted nucleic acid-binding protein
VTRLYLLDADVIIELIRGKTTTLSLLQAISEAGDVASICDVVVAEVFSGIPAERRAESTRYLAQFRYLDTPSIAAEQAGIWRYDYRRKGVSLTATDLLIAATALIHNATLLTGNVRDYPMPELDVVPMRRDEP